MEAIYDTNANQYIESWLTANMKTQYDAFLSLIPPGCHILDGGCGSGRDTLYFLQHGYSVSAFDSSIEMVKYAQSFTGVPIERLRWQDLNYIEAFEGVWASATLLHIPRRDMKDVFMRIHLALKHNGILFASFKDKAKDFASEGRFFTAYNRDTMQDFLKDLNLFDTISITETHDSRKGRTDEIWLNVLARKK